MDLDELKTLLGKTYDENVQDSSRMARIFRRIYDFPLPTIAAVNGAAIAGGTGFATMCDFTLAVPEAKFGPKCASDLCRPSFLRCWSGR
jgi:methylglutaconyl-CoA hydratase